MSETVCAVFPSRRGEGSEKHFSDAADHVTSELKHGRTESDIKLIFSSGRIKPPPYTQLKVLKHSESEHILRGGTNEFEARNKGLLLDVNFENGIVGKRFEGNDEQTNTHKLSNNFLKWRYREHEMNTESPSPIPTNPIQFAIPSSREIHSRNLIHGRNFFFFFLFFYFIK